MGVARERSVKFMYEKEIEKLEMTPEKWYELNSILSDSEYSRIVMDYQEREFNIWCLSLLYKWQMQLQGQVQTQGQVRHNMNVEKKKHLIK